MKRSETRCIVLSCKFNKGEQGTLCDYTLYQGECQFSPKMREWRERTGYQDPHPVEIPVVADSNGRGPHSLTAHVAAVHRAAEPMTPEQARQRALALEVER